MRPISVVVEGVEYRSIKQAAKAFGIDRNTVRMRQRAGMSVEDAIRTPPRPQREGQPHEVRAKKVAALAVKGMSATQIAHDLGTSSAVVHTIAREFGIRLEQMKGKGWSTADIRIRERARETSWDLEDWTS